MSKREGFTNGEPRRATADEMKARWGGGRPGEFFRCSLCGYRFTEGDYWRWQYANGRPLTNPMTCESCDGPDLLDRWEAINAEWKEATTSGRFWSMAQKGTSE